MAELDLVMKVLEVDRVLDAATIPHAFGGAIALAYYAEPRATVDIDVNVFVSTDHSREVLSALAGLGVKVEGADAEIARSDQCRTRWGSNPVDLFFADLALHAAMQRAMRRVPFARGEIPILAPEHLMVCKALFNRSKDWLDIEQMLIAVSDLRTEEVWRWMDDIAGEDDGRTQRLRSMVAELLGED